MRVSYLIAAAGLFFGLGMASNANAELFQTYELNDVVFSDGGTVSGHMAVHFQLAPPYPTGSAPPSPAPWQIAITTSPGPLFGGASYDRIVSSGGGFVAHTSIHCIFTLPINLFGSFSGRHARDNFRELGFGFSDNGPSNYAVTR